MAENEPATEQPYGAGDTTPWTEARDRLADADTYWLATVRKDGMPHLVPCNLERDPHGVIAVSRDALDPVVEGEATTLTDEATLYRVAEAYMTKYRWPVSVRDGAYYADGAPTAGPPPYDVYEFVPTTAFGFPTEDGAFSPTRWRFG